MSQYLETRDEIREGTDKLFKKIKLGQIKVKIFNKYNIFCSQFVSYKTFICKYSKNIFKWWTSEFEISFYQIKRPLFINTIDNKYKKLLIYCNKLASNQYYLTAAMEYKT